MTLEMQIPRQCGARVCFRYSGSCTNSIGSNNARAGNTANGNGSSTAIGKTNSIANIGNTASSGICIASTNTANTGSTRARTHPVQSKKSRLTHRIQAPDKETTVRFTVDMSVRRVPQAVGAGC